MVKVLVLWQGVAKHFDEFWKITQIVSSWGNLGQIDYFNCFFKSLLIKFVSKSRQFGMIKTFKIMKPCRMLALWIVFKESLYWFVFFFCKMREELWMRDSSFQLVLIFIRFQALLSNIWLNWFVLGNFLFSLSEIKTLVIETFIPVFINCFSPRGI